MSLTLRFLFSSAIAVVCSILGTGTKLANAADSATPSPWTWSAYGTLSRYHETADQMNFVRDLGQRGGDQLRSGGWKPDTRVGLQGAYRLDSQTEAVLQVVARDKPEQSVVKAIEWAYLAYRPEPDWQVRMGRLGIDVFLLSDYRSLGYAQTTVRPNWEFYGFLPVYSLDGGDVTYTLADGPVRWKFKTQYGATKADVPINNQWMNFASDGLLDMTVTREAGPWRLKAGVASMKLKEDAPLEPLPSTLSAIAAAGISDAATLNRELSFKGARVRYLSLGAAFDDGEWLLQGELSRITSDRLVVPQGSAAYILAGRRFGVWTPFAGVSGLRPRYDIYQPQSNWGALNAARDAAIVALNTSRIDQNTVTLGVRWDVDTQAALKVQLDHMRVRAYGSGLWSTNLTTFPQRVNVLSVGLDWVY